MPASKSTLGCTLRVVNTSACLSRVCVETDREDTSALSLFAGRVISRDVSVLLPAIGEDCLPLAVSSRGTLYSAKLAKLRRIIPHSWTGIRSNQENA